jgi:hypothetical protein
MRIAQRDDPQEQDQVQNAATLFGEADLHLIPLSTVETAPPLKPR